MRLFDLNAVPIQLVDCIHEMLRYDPLARLTTYQALTHSYFRDVEPRLRPNKPLLPGFVQGPITPAPSIGDGYSRPSLPIPYNPIVVNPISPPQSANMDVDSAMAPRSMPSSHAHGALAQHKPAFGAGDGDSIMSDSAQSGYSVPVMPPPSSYPMVYQNGLQQQYPGQAASHMSRSGSLQSYDQSLYDQSSVYSVPVGVTAPSDSTISPNASQRSLDIEPPRVELHPLPSTSAAPGFQKRGRGLGSLFGGSGAASVASPSMSLKRTPSEVSMIEAAQRPVAASSQASLDPKKAKKEAEKAAKEEAKAKRERDRLAAQARSRAVMMKQRGMVANTGTAEVIQPEFVGPTPSARPRAIVDKGKARSVLSPALPQIAEDGGRLKPMDAARFRQRRRGDDDADVHSVSSNETGDDRRYSISTMNTMDSDPGPHRGPRGLSVLARSPSHSSLGSTSRLSVASSPNLGTVYRASTPASTTSSLDHQLITNMAGLSAGQAQGDWSARPSIDSQGSRLKSSSSGDPRYSPYHKPTLPGIEAFDFPPGTFMASPGSMAPHHTPSPNPLDRQSVGSAAASMFSGQSVPISVSGQSHSSHQHPGMQGQHYGGQQPQESQRTSPSADEAMTPMMRASSRTEMVAGR